MFDAGQGKLNSWQNSWHNHSRSPVILHKTPLLILLPLNSSTGFPNWSFFGITPEKRICHDQAAVSITCLKLFLGHSQLWYSSDQQLAFTHTPLGKQAPAGACQTNIETEPLDRKYTMGGAVVSCIQFGNHGLKLKTCMESTSVKGAANNLECLESRSTC